MGGIWRYKRNKTMNFGKLGSLSRPSDKEMTFIVKHHNS